MADMAALYQQLHDTITSMEQEGLVDDQFRLCFALKEVNGPFFVAELLPSFCSDSQITITEMTQALAQPLVDFYEMEELCMKIRGAILCIGALQMLLACGDLRQAIEHRSKDRCTVAVDAMRHEFLKLQSKIDIVIQLEVRIVSHN